MDNEENKENLNPQKKSKWWIIFIIILILIGLGFIGLKLVDKYMPNFNHINIRNLLPEWGESESEIILEDTPIKTKNPPMFFNFYGDVYLPVDFVKEYIDKYIFWEESSKKLTITTENKVIKMKTDELTAYVNDKVLNLDFPIEMINNTAYLPKILLESLYDIKITCNYALDYNLVIVDYTNRPKSLATIISKKSNVRYQPNIKSPIVYDLFLDDSVYLYSESDDNGWIKIRTMDGIVGYILTKDIGEVTEVPPKEKEIITQRELWKPENGKVNLVWDYVTTIASSSQSSKLKPHKGLDVLSPTWFEFADVDGNIKNTANKVYIDFAHSQGYQVWALFGNKLDGAFNSKITHEILTNTDARENMIKQLLALTSMYDLDGINIDFEEVLVEDGDYFLQFIRELTPFLKEQGVIISVDVYVPRNHTKHYQRNELAKIVDYIAVMAYDEHWSTSKISGSVASIGWVEDAIIASLEQEQIPPEKLLLGLPYYTRLWQETPNDKGGVNVKSSAHGIEAGKKILKDKNIEPIWDEQTGQYYGEYQQGEVTYKIWLEEERSLQEKLNLVEKYNLAGIAGWQRVFTNDSIWELLYENLKG